MHEHVECDTARTSGAIMATLSSFRNGSAMLRSPSMPFLRLLDTNQHLQNAIVVQIISPHMQMTAMAPKTRPGTVLFRTSLVQYDLDSERMPSVSPPVSVTSAKRRTKIQESVRSARTSCQA